MAKTRATKEKAKVKTKAHVSHAAKTDTWPETVRIKARDLRATSAENKGT